MKPILLVAFLIFGYGIWAQTPLDPTRPLISGRAPSFSATSTMGMVNFPDDYFGKWKILFSHPADFTPVCTSEIMALAATQDEFKKLKTALIVISTDRLNSHIEWVKSIESISIEGVAPVKIEFPLVSDSDLEISRSYGILQPGHELEKDIRGVMIIDPDNQIRAFFHYPQSVGRNIEEIKRTLIALQTQDKYDVFTPANWQPGDDVLLKSPASKAEAEKLEERKDPNLRKVTWYMWFRKL